MRKSVSHRSTPRKHINDGCKFGIIINIDGVKMTERHKTKKAAERDAEYYKTQGAQVEVIKL